MSISQSLSLRQWSARQPLLFLGVAAVLWWLVYQSLMPASEAAVAALPVARSSHLGGALQFFFYDTPKVLLLLTGIVFVMVTFAQLMPANESCDFLRRLRHTFISSMRPPDS